MSLTSARLCLCHISILKVTCKRVVVNTTALKAAAGVPTDDLTLVALISAAQRCARLQIMESGSAGGGGVVMDVESLDAL